MIETQPQPACPQAAMAPTDPDLMQFDRQVIEGELTLRQARRLRQPPAQGQGQQPPRFSPEELRQLAQATGSRFIE